MQIHSLFRLLFFLIVIHGLNASAQTKGDSRWSMFRGPNGSGVCESGPVPLEIALNTNMIWRHELPPGHSSPVLTDKLILLSAIDQDKLFTICLNRETGAELWRAEAPRARHERLDGRNNPASPSPVTDGKSVYLFFTDFGLISYDLKGKELWRYPLGPFNNVYGMAASPILAGDNVILACDQNTQSFIIAVNRKSGKLAWKTDRPEAMSGHCTPIVYQPETGDLQVIVPGSFNLTAYSSRTGARVWWVSGLSFEMKSTPVISDGMVFINGYASPMNQPENIVHLPLFTVALASFDLDKNGLISPAELPKNEMYELAPFMDLSQDGQLNEQEWNNFKASMASVNAMLGIMLGGSGDMTQTSSVWAYHKNVPQLPSPLVYKGVLFMLSDNGFLTTLRPESGEVIATGRLTGAGSSFYASPVATDGKVFIVGRTGKITVLGATGTLDILAQTDLKEECNATPAIAGGRIYLRTTKAMYCFGR